ncbi:YihY/virulence factor BrkB family protein [Ramlibacter tataouinensis]|uniref:YihY/virulence factor BrkB family protein n=1 Tax=Ramlibacter tataouinensis TaxID=94132 RepID=UPI0022F38D1D|nr:YihY/virulence factor BrkB family protein [Ramlibacter tataouinensis]WBX99973.1 YihY/virulence factor BrkB family protein [Ramlibacter tataouinensis]
MAWHDRIPHRLRRAGRPAYPVWRAAQLWSEAGGLRMSAAMSFYGILSLAPLLLVLVGLFGWWMDRQALSQVLVDQAGSMVGPQAAAVVQQALASTRQPAEGLLATAIGFGVLLFGATGVFGELQQALAEIWSQGRQARVGSAWWLTASLRLRGLAYILAFGFLVVASTVASTLLSVFSASLGDFLLLETLLRLLNEAMVLGLWTLLFVALMRLSAGPKPATRFLLLGALVGAILFSLGRQLLAWYLSTAAVVSAYGAAGSLVAVLMWIYFSSGVLLFAAAFARAAEDTRKRTAGEPVEEPAHAARASSNGQPRLRAVGGSSHRRRGSR